jgi:hypothetical protein
MPAQRKNLGFKYSLNIGNPWITSKNVPKSKFWNFVTKCAFTQANYNTKIRP